MSHKIDDDDAIKYSKFAKDVEEISEKFASDNRCHIIAHAANNKDDILIIAKGCDRHLSNIVFTIMNEYPQVKNNILSHYFKLN